MVSFRLAALVPFALAATVAGATDNGAAVNDAVTNINNAVLSLIDALNDYEGGILQSKPVFDATLDIHYVNRQGYTAAISSSNFTEAESQTIVNNVNDSVGVTIPESVTIIEGKKPLFDAANITSLVEATILLLKSDHETFSLAVGSKLSADEVVPGLAAAAKIDASLEGAALYYAV